MEILRTIIRAGIRDGMTYQTKRSIVIANYFALILIGVVVLLILFSATWLGFYVAREITGPIQNLAEATREVALGNYNIRLVVNF